MEFGKIYKITNTENDFIYIGSTKQTLEERLDNHKYCYNEWLKCNFRRGYISSFEILRFKNYKIELIETVYEDKLINREYYHINNNECVNILYNINLDKPKIKCPCGMEIDSKYRYKHSKSKNHRRNIKQLHALANNILYEPKKYKTFKKIENCIEQNL